MHGLATAKVMAPSPVPRLSEMLTSYATNHVKPGSTEHHCVAHLKRHLGHLEPHTINSEIAKTYAEARRTDVWTTPGRGAEVRGVADSTIKRELTTLRAAVTWAWKSDRKGWFRGEGKPEFAMPRLQQDGSRERWLTKDEANRLVDACHTPHLRIFVMLALQTAARKEAIEDLTWEQAKLETGHVDFGLGRGNKLRPRQRMSERLIKELKAAFQVRTTDFVLEWNGRKAGDVKVAFRKASIRAGFVTGHRVNKHGKPVPVTDVTPHILKHTAVTWMVQSGTMTYEEIASFAETSAAMIEKVYGHHDPKLYEKAHAATAF
ncbi:MAG: hypothetical protein VR70_05180 [Rhodospirillaceae bacterium BRH_c57]|nr:MAG: hypothetical protein VR70_05180 [Rhodospirillaceae bacterium BRH_c57]